MIWYMYYFFCKNSACTQISYAIFFLEKLKDFVLFSLLHLPIKQYTLSSLNCPTQHHLPLKFWPNMTITAIASQPSPHPPPTLVSYSF
ncbi:hypothetical protein HanRHA438_Chr04g0191171 [Helianthus annuus]|uniref:Uncharacterized protein n=1 Tax=Helianthus annuus TaxID=4232 RepID=A0A251V1D3_HELAN|nr:hypothetical protein HanXRQr2_Chr04g0181461 [Helianthus annuus]KAJ0582085.1 hypothetical protein HanHA300_Chr04g0148331 [Helianthus annuus]KAJ0590240.1 hypothetical protein HanIR_Chr04g0195171 [Helianthus annuus]KAJ0598070.1 hypothetical protein HanHA89_Chr04g0161721 [Helianthus annuus]KAJ0758703.1 hypothetical protein HanLR1_Chr04g0153331 [Helianthus annuus]